MTKEPAIAARYAAQSRGQVVAIDAAELLRPPSALRYPQLVADMQAAGASDAEMAFARAGSADFSGGAGVRALEAAGAEERTVQYAIADAEWRHGGEIAPHAAPTERHMPWPAAHRC